MVTRMKGVLESKSQVLTFLDSHIEATDGWLEPLLERIYLNPKAIACPVIEEQEGSVKVFTNEMYVLILEMGVG